MDLISVVTSVGWSSDTATACPEPLRVLPSTLANVWPDRIEVRIEHTHTEALFFLYFARVIIERSLMLYN